MLLYYIFNSINKKCNKEYFLDSEQNKVTKYIRIKSFKVSTDAENGTELFEVSSCCLEQAHKHCPFTVMPK